MHLKWCYSYITFLSAVALEQNTQRNPQKTIEWQQLKLKHKHGKRKQHGEQNSAKTHQESLRVSDRSLEEQGQYQLDPKWHDEPQPLLDIHFDMRWYTMVYTLRGQTVGAWQRHWQQGVEHRKS